MNKFGIAVGLLAVVLGLVAIDAVSGNPVLKKGHEEGFEHEGGELERPRPHPKPRPEEDGPKGPPRGRHEPGPGKKPEGKPGRRHLPRKPEHHGPRPHMCGRGPEGGHEHGGFEGDELGGEFEESGRGGFEGGHRGREGHHGGHEGRGPEFEGGEEFGGRGEGRHGHEGRHGGEGRHRGEGRHGSFKGVGGFGGLRKEKEFDAGVRVGARNSNRNQFNKQKGLAVGEQKAVAGGSSSGEVNNVEGVHKHKNLNNDRLVVKESQRGTEDVDAFRGQNERHDDNHFGASDSKFLAAQAGESGLSENENEREFEGDLHKRDSFSVGGGAGLVGGQF